MLGQRPREGDLFHKRSISRFLVPKTLEIESFFDEHAVEFVPGDGAIVIAVSLVVQSSQAVVYFLLPEFELPLPGLQMFEALRDELVAGKFIVIVFECVLEEPQDVFVDVYGEVGGEAIEFCIGPAERGARGVDRSEAGFLGQLDVIHSLQVIISMAFASIFPSPCKQNP